MKKTLYYIQSKEYKDIVYKCFDKNEMLKYIQEERLSDKYYKTGEISVNLDEFFKVKVNHMSEYINKLIRSNKNV